MAHSDAELVESALAGEAQAFEQIVKRYQRLVFNIVYHYLGGRNEVEDLAQEIFLKVYRSLDRFDTSRPLKAWIGKIASNACLDELRRARVRRERSFADFSEEQEDRIRYLYGKSAEGDGLTEDEARESLSLLHQALDELNDKDRMAFVLRELEEQDYAEIADAMGVSQVAVRIRVSRARKKLQKRIKSMLARQDALSA
ncbi:MAG TPA: RNA polymerase sigma factor [Acidobacteriota bacterium]|nr:RNA polymerase sigma factor [Acidobacteriota bacterium]